MHKLERRTSRQGAEGRLAILRAARRLFSERGFRGVSLDDVAREAGASKGLVLYHFVTKDRLFAYVIGEVKEELFSRLQAALMGQAGAREKLLALITVYLRLARSQRRLWRIALHEAYGLGEVSRQLLLDCRQSSLGMISSVLEEGMERGEFRKMDPQLASLCLLGIISERVLTGPGPAQEPDAEQLAAAIADMLLHGIDSRRGDTAPASERAP